MEDNSEMLTRYLLGELNAEEAAQLEKRYFQDADFLGELQAVECDLSDSYVRGELPVDRRKRFEQRFLTSPALRQQALFADALAQSLAHHRDAVQPDVPRLDRVARHPAGYFWVRKWLPL